MLETSPPETPALEVRDLHFRFPADAAGNLPAPLFSGLRMSLARGSRCLLLGQNGVGKTTLLRILAGRHMVPPEAVRVLGRSAFHDTSLAGPVLFLGGPFPFDVDLSVEEVLRGQRSARIDALLELLGIERGWRMARLSAGQRRRVQILLGLMQPREVVLLDEVTADLDVLARADLLAFLREESEQRGQTVLYATHVLDGLERWATHLCFLSPGPAGTRLRVLAPVGEVAELRGPSGGSSALLLLTERWLREDRGR